MIELLVAIVVGAALGALAHRLVEAWRARRDQRRWLETYARYLGLEPGPRESTTALRRRLATYLTRH